MNEQQRSIAEIETLIQSNPDAVSDEELVNYLAFAKTQEELDRENIRTALLFA